MRPDEDPLEHLGRRRRCRTGRRARPSTGDQPAGHSFRPAAIRVACQSSSVEHDRRRSSRGSGRPRRGGCPRSARAAATLRITTAATHAGQHEHGEDVGEQREPALVAEPRERGVAVDRARSSPSRSSGTGRGSPRRSTRASGPAPSRCSSLRWPSTIVASLRSRAAARRRSARPACRMPHQADEAAAPGARTGRRRRRAAPRARARRPGRHAARAFRSSAVIAGTISCRSPITA